jgi:hypothetical protein
MRQMGARQKIDGREHSAALSPGKFPPDEEFAGFENTQASRGHERDRNSSNHGLSPCKGPEMVRPDDQFSKPLKPKKTENHLKNAPLTRGRIDQS